MRHFISLTTRTNDELNTHTHTHIDCFQPFSPVILTTGIVHPGNNTPVRDFPCYLRNKVRLHGIFHATLTSFSVQILIGWLHGLIFTLVSQGFSCLIWCLRLPSGFPWTQLNDNDIMWMCVSTTNSSIPNRNTFVVLGRIMYYVCIFCSYII